MTHRPTFVDLASLPEDERIGVIGHMVAEHGKTVAVALDNQPDKIARYKRKMKEQFPGVVVLDEGPGPTPGVHIVKFGPQ